MPLVKDKHHLFYENKIWISQILYLFSKMYHKFRIMFQDKENTFTIFVRRKSEKKVDFITATCS